MTEFQVFRSETRRITDNLVDSIFGMRYFAKQPKDIFAYCYGYTVQGTYRRALRKWAREKRREERLLGPARREERRVL